MTNRLPYAALLTLVLLSAVSAAETSWPSGFGKAIALQAQTVPDNMSLGRALLPYVVFDKTACTTARLPTGASKVPVTSALIRFQDAGACTTHTPLDALQLYIEASSAAEIDQFRAALTLDLPMPCFTGQVAQADARRHAPPRTILAWRTATETIVLASEQGIDDAVALSVLVRAPKHAASDQGGQELRQGIEKDLPIACL